MTKEEQIKFIQLFLKDLETSILRDIRNDKIPETWDGIELRWFIEMRSRTNWGTDTKRRKKNFENDLRVRGINY